MYYQENRTYNNYNKIIEIFIDIIEFKKNILKYTIQITTSDL